MPSLASCCTARRSTSPWATWEALAATEGPLPDPKSRIGALADLKVGFRHSSRGEAEAAFREEIRLLYDSLGMLFLLNAPRRAPDR